MVEGAGANKVSGVLSEASCCRCGTPNFTKKEADLFSRPLLAFIKKLFLAGNNFLGGLHDMRSVKSVCLEKFCRST